jgi:hypothetical protein
MIWLFPMTLDSIHNIQTAEVVDAALACTSSPDDVVLTQELWHDKTASVLSAVDSAGNLLTATNYVPVTRTLTVTGWVTPATTCAISYEVDGTTDWTGFGAVVAFSPMGAWVIFLGIGVALMWSGVSSIRNH